MGKYRYSTVVILLDGFLEFAKSSQAQGKTGYKSGVYASK